MELRRIGLTDVQWHARFFDFVASVFGSLDVRHWQQWRTNGWTENYEVFALTLGEDIISTIGCFKMRLVIAGEERSGIQLGAVATRESHRHQGLSRRLMSAAIEARAAADQPIILFANGTVLDFYPRFGFRRIPQRSAMARVRAVPAGTLAHSCRPDRAADRTRLTNLCARASPIRGPLAARDYFEAVLWHLICRPLSAFWVPQRDAVIVTSTEGDRLVLHDVIATEPFDLGPVIPHLIERPITALEFGFDPDDWWPGAECTAFDDSTSRLFVRDDAGAITGPVQFPGCAHT